MGETLTGLSILIPAYNESNYIIGTIVELKWTMRLYKVPHEIVVVNDGSTDDTAYQVSKILSQVKYVELKTNQGKGAAIREGSSVCSYGYTLIVDADGSTDPSAIKQMVGNADRGAEVVIGSRHLPGSFIRFCQPPLRKLFGTAYRILCRTLFGVKVTDINCGFKMIRTDLLREYMNKTRSNDWLYDIELLVLLQRAGFKLYEIPVVWGHFDKGRSSLRQAGLSLVELIKLRKRLGR